MQDGCAGRGVSGAAGRILIMFNDLHALLAPKTIAVVGASRTPGKVGYVVLHNLVTGGFEGKIIPVNPQASEILGLTCAKSLTAAGEAIDLVVIVVPVKDVLGVVEDAVSAGVKALAVITVGFGEAGDEGKRIEREMAERCAAVGIRILGPNCLGLINTEHKMNASFAQQMPDYGGITIISQSGALCTAILDMAAGRGLGLAKLISMGNKADICESVLLPVLAADPQTKVIACYLENIKRGVEFIRAGEAAGDMKPVVVLKAGSTSAGARAAMSHTGQLAGGEAAYSAAFRRAGMIRAENFEQLFDITIAFSMQPLPQGDRIAVITNAGGPGILAADAIEKLGMKIQPLQKNIADRLRAQLPDTAHVGNPIDVLGDATPERYLAAINAALDDGSVDAVIVILTPQAMTQPVETAQTIIKAFRGNKPVLAVFMGGQVVMEARKTFVKAEVPDYATPDRAAVALRAMCDYAEWRRRPPRTVTRFPVDKISSESVIQRYKREGLHQVIEADAKSILSSYGFNVMVGDIATTAEEACSIAQRIGYPVAMKIASPDIVHKSDVGGVHLSLWSAQEVIDAFDLMMLRVGRRVPTAKITGVYVEKMANAGREVILGMTRDPQFGPILMFGLGGVFVEVMRDVAFYLAPITDGEAREMLESTRSYALLKGARGQAPVDLDAIASAIQRISQLAVELPEIAELDINPFIVGPPGVTPVVADARMTLDYREGQGKGIGA